jgi:hypothetical protein
MVTALLESGKTPPEPGDSASDRTGRYRARPGGPTTHDPEGARNAHRYRRQRQPSATGHTIGIRAIGLAAFGAVLAAVAPNVKVSAIHVPSGIVPTSVLRLLLARVSDDSGLLSVMGLSSTLSAAQRSNRESRLAGVLNSAIWPDWHHRHV